MRNPHRSFSVLNLPGSRELAERLVPPAAPPPLCTGFRLQGAIGSLVFLCDDRWDRDLEYAVFDEHTQRQIEAVTFSRCDLEQAVEIVDHLLAGERWVSIASRFPDLQHDVDCPHCAAATVIPRSAS